MQNCCNTEVKIWKSYIADLLIYIFKGGRYKNANLITFPPKDFWGNLLILSSIKNVETWKGDYSLQYFQGLLLQKFAFPIYIFCYISSIPFDFEYE